MISSSSDASAFPLPPSPAVNRSTALHRPPIGRAASSISHAQAQRGYGRLPAPDDGLPGQLREARWCEVNGLLEEGAVEWVGLVEQPEHMDPAFDHETLERHLGPRDEIFDQDVPRPGAARRHLGLLEDLLEARECRHEPRRVVGANHAARGREPQRLEHARVAGARGQLRHVLIEPVPLEPRHGHAAPGKLAPLDVLVARREGGRYRVALEPQALGNRRGDDRGGVVHAGHAGDRVRPRELVRLLRRSLRVGEVERQEPVGLGLFEGAGQLGCDGELDIQPARRLHERRSAVGGGWKQQQQPRLGGARHCRALTF